MTATDGISHVWRKIMYSVLGMASAVLLCLLTNELSEKRLCPRLDRSNCATCGGPCKGDISDCTVVPLPLFHFVEMQNESNHGAEGYGDDFVRVLTVKKEGSVTHETSKTSKKSNATNKQSSKASKKSSTDRPTVRPTYKPTDKPTDGATEDPCEHTENCVALYKNDFESPHYDMSTLIFASPCDYGNVYVTPPMGENTINDLYGTPENTFAQDYTVESIFFTNQEYQPNVLFVDPDGIGGQYAIGMYSEQNEDRLALSFNGSTYKYINVAMDIASMSNECPPSTPSPETNAGPKFILSAIDSPEGEALLSGDVLDTAVMTGKPRPNDWTYLWTRNTIALDISASTNGLVSIVWDCIQDDYAAFDNLAVAASNTEGLVPNL